MIVELITIMPFESGFATSTIYNMAMPANPTAPIAHDTAFACAAAAALGFGDAAAPLDDAEAALVVSLGLPEMSC